jgi:hypothetical protein
MSGVRYISSFSRFLNRRIQINYHRAFRFFLITCSDRVRLVIYESDFYGMWVCVFIELFKILFFSAVLYKSQYLISPVGNYGVLTVPPKIIDADL